MQQLMTTRQAAAMLGLSEHTLEAWRKRGGGPRFLKLNRAVRYRPEDIDAFLAGAEREHTSEVAA